MAMMTGAMAVLGSISLLTATAGCATGPDATGAVPGSVMTTVHDAPASTRVPVGSETITVPPPPGAAALPPERSARARAVADAFADPSTDRIAMALAAFAAAGLPVIGTGSTSITTTAGDAIGIPWPVLWSAVGSSSTESRLSLVEVARLMRFVDPSAPIDDRALAGEILADLQTRLRLDAADDGPTFVARVVAAEAADREIDLASQSTTADDVLVSSPTVTLLLASALRSVQAAVTAADRPATVAGSGTTGNRSGLRKPDPRVGVIDAAACADDGMNGWMIWIASKVSMGASIPGLGQWSGIWSTVVEAAVSRGALSPDAVVVTEFGGKVAGAAGALISAILFQAQVSGRVAHVTMAGSGPLIRTKTTSHGEARQITIEVAYNGADRESVAQRNCILALMSAFGNNAQQVIGSASSVEVEVSGGVGFANGLAAGDSIVLFGPSTFQPVQTADNDGRVTVPVQGRAQREQLPDDVEAVDKQFSIIAEASLDPITADTLGKSFADSFLCAGTGLGGGTGSDIATGCLDAILNIVKQFHWDLGEFAFTLVDWSAGWVIDETIEAGDFPFTMTAASCAGPRGPWDIALLASPAGMSIDGTFSVTFPDADGTESGVGAVDISWTGSGNGVSVSSSGTAQARLTADGDGYLISFIPGSYVSAVSTQPGTIGFSNHLERFELHVRPATERECG